MTNATTNEDNNAILACTISRDVQNFDLLIEDMEAALGERWGDLGFAEALAFFGQPEAESLEFVALAIDGEDEDDLTMMGEIISRAKEKRIKVVLIAEDVTPAALHQLLRKGADEFVPYPLPEGELQEAIARMNKPDPAVVTQETAVSLPQGASKEGALFVVHGLAGGVGSTTMAVNLAWELATTSDKASPKVCLIDLDLQFGTVSTYLDLPRRETVFEMLSDTASMDDDMFSQALQSYEDKMEVLTAPSDMVPLDLITPEDIQRVIDTARKHFDYVIVDMPSTLVQWSETILQAAHVYFAVIELDMRSAQNALRLKRALQAEELPFNKLRFALNRAPKFTDLNGKSRVKRMGESLGISIDLQLPDGGKPVMQSGDHGLPLASSAAKNPLRREIAKLAKSLHSLGSSDAEAA
ncbi:MULTISPECIES: AAA family ATPase [unclassified Ruegeria]|uniref:AAA family ATPase n=1 Tax=unclassified Ruegeria TaxID=2625375 RepID=UPI001ADA7F63|nr:MULTISPECIES: AAA family ATPase [unclassified Ruegeria]MBO9410046.1 AAA family ATPase [Ruegeria sp. R8_1]MBO9414735.1 AAA family ATPase [Ruegeria sp. R8_2]